MRVLHTSDWHLGRTLEGRQRLPEQEQFLDQLCAIASSEDVDIVIVAGDVFDSSNPPAAAEELYYDGLERLSAGGKRGVVVIAGNHDSPERIRAANPLAAKHGISLVGYPGEDLGPGGPDGGARRIRTGPGWMEIASPRMEETVLVVTLAYPSEARLNEVLSESLADRSLQAAYSDRIADLIQRCLTSGAGCGPKIVAGHLFTAGGRESDSERQIQLGGAFVVHPQAFACGANYVALGHLHRPQAVSDMEICRYSGSPLSYSFSEAGQQKEVVVVDIPASRTAAQPLVKPIRLTCGKPLKKWAPRTYEEALVWCEDPRNRDSWVDLEIVRDQPLSASEVSALRSAHPGIVNIRWRGTLKPLSGEEKRISEMPLIERFKLFCQRAGAEASQELLDLFLELISEDRKEESGE
ncbi:MAG: exonuclease subunit SbcD [Bacillota bacterium]|jgi:exonuclease SbcD